MKLWAIFHLALSKVNFYKKTPENEEDSLREFH